MAYEMTEAANTHTEERPAETPRPGRPIEERPKGGSTTSGSSTQDDGTGGGGSGSEGGSGG